MRQNLLSFTISFLFLGSRSAVLCIRCNLTIHVKYSRSESDPVFDPKINFNCPERILIFSDGLIHTINVQLELNKQQKSCSTTLDINYVNKRDRMTLILDCNNQATTDDNNKLTTKPILIDANDDTKKLTADEPKQGTSSNCFVKENIVARIIADFAECETDVSCVEKYQRPQQSNSSGECSNKNNAGQFDELVISCGSTSATKTNSTGGSSGSGQPSGRVRLISHRSHRLLARSVISTKSAIKTIDLQPCSSSTSTSSAATNGNTKTTNLDKAAKAYEFSEDTEKCEKISIFRKRRLADKKYEFSEDNLENIIPFTKLRSNRQTFPLRPGRSAKQQPNNSMSPSPHTNALFSAMQAGSQYDVPAHTHRASPSHGFRSPCGSPVGNRFLMSPPGRTSSLYGKSPTYTKPFSSPRHISKQRTSYLDQVESCSNPLLLSPRSDDFEMHKIQPLSEVKPSNNIEASAAVLLLPTAEKFDADKPNCSKKLIRRYVEEDDATSVITSEEGKF